MTERVEALIDAVFAARAEKTAATKAYIEALVALRKAGCTHPTKYTHDESDLMGHMYRGTWCAACDRQLSRRAL